MDYNISEKDVSATVSDFLVFCDFIEATKPSATAKGDLSTKGCYEVNKILSIKRENAKLTDRMHQYPEVSLWFSVAIETGVIAQSDVKGGKTIYDATEKYPLFKQLNAFTQYMTIFQVWYCFIDIGAQYIERGSEFLLRNLIDRVFIELPKNGYSKWIARNGRSNTFDSLYGGQSVQLIMEHCYKTGCVLRALGLIKAEESNETSKYYNHPMFDRVKPTQFGCVIMKTCDTRRYAWFNVYTDLSVHIDDRDVFEKTDEAIENGEEEFITPFLYCFPEGSIDEDAICEMVYGHSNSPNDERIFDFKVMLGKKCYRVIRCAPQHTFEELHLAIQEAFDFDNDHLYSFYLDGKMYSGYAISHPYSEKPPYANAVDIGGERLRDKQQILYLLDYGDMWEFNIKLNVQLNKDKATYKKTVIIECVGEAPEQYPEYY